MGNDLNSLELARKMRISAVKMVHEARASHIASALSIVDILAVLYGRVMNISPALKCSRTRDRLILSKGHACVALYAVLAELEIIPKTQLATYGQDFSWLMSHVSHKVPGVEFSTGSLGHGLPFGVGKALAGKSLAQDWKTFVILSDGEMDEGSNWEAFMFAAHHKLHNLIAIIDYNKLQSLGPVAETIGLEPLADKLNAFGWCVHEVDGHNHDEIYAALVAERTIKPTIVIAHTIKGKGVDYMENKVEWHYKNPNDQQLQDALNQLGDMGA